MQAHHLKPYRPYCDHCERAYHERASSNFSEAKEEELECHYCKQRNISEPAETLFNGLPSCMKCRKKSSVSVIARSTTSQRIVHNHMTSDKGCGDQPAGLREPLNPIVKNGGNLIKQPEVSETTTKEDQSVMKQQISKGLTTTTTTSNFDSENRMNVSGPSPIPIAHSTTLSAAAK